MSETEYPISKNVGRCEAKHYWITAALWDTGYGPSYEIGIREKAERQNFTLIQGRWHEHSVLVAARAIGHLLDSGMKPEHIHEVFP